MKLLIVLFFLSFNSLSFCQKMCISTESAENYVGEEVWIVGKVVSMKLAKDEKQMNYLNLDLPYPKSKFTIVYSQRFRYKNQINLEDLEGKKVKFLGKIIWYEKKDGTKTLEIFNPKEYNIIEEENVEKKSKSETP